jgi:hypothetical protein
MEHRLPMSRGSALGHVKTPAATGTLVIGSSFL